MLQKLTHALIQRQKGKHGRLRVIIVLLKIAHEKSHFRGAEHKDRSWVLAHGLPHAIVIHPDLEVIRAASTLGASILLD